MRLNTCGERPHEKIFFANNAIQYRIVSRRTEIQITSEMYMKDADFGRVYRAIKNGTTDKVSDIKALATSKAKVTAKMKHDAYMARIL